MADQALSEIWSEMTPAEYAVTSNIKFDVQDTPAAWQYQATGTTPDQILLGLYIPDDQPRITIFEQSINRAKVWMGDLYNSIKAVLAHEIWQHGLGLDHTKETIAAGMIPACTLAMAMSINPKVKS